MPLPSGERQIFLANDLGPLALAWYHSVTHFFVKQVTQ